MQAFLLHNDYSWMPLHYYSILMFSTEVVTSIQTGCQPESKFVASSFCRHQYFSLETFDQPTSCCKNINLRAPSILYVNSAEQTTTRTHKKCLSQVSNLEPSVLNSEFNSGAVRQKS